MNGSAALPPAATTPASPAFSGAAPWVAQRAVLTLIVLAALALRLFGLNWDDGRDLHPDELYVAKDVLIQRIDVSWPPDVANILDPDRSRLNPRSIHPDTGLQREYPYGALPLLVTDTLAGILDRVTGIPWTAADHAYLLGRTLSALLDSLTVVVVYGIARRLVRDDVTVALAAALFAATVPLAIQLAHFFTTDSWLTFFVSITLYAATRAAESGAGRWYAAAGAGFGLALATKGSVFALAGVIAAAMLFGLAATYWQERSFSPALFRLPKHIALAGFTALLAFALFEPYALVRPGIYIQSLRTQAEIVSGRFDIPFTRVFVGTEPVIYHLEQLLKWGFGPVAGVLALAGVILIARDCWRHPSAAAWILLCWVVGYSFVIFLAETKFLRYLAPLVPVLAVAAGVALGRIHTVVRRRWRAPWATATVAVLVLGSLAWTMAFMSIYATEHPRLTASRWIYANAPPGSRLSWEYWDDRLPKPLGPGLTEADFQYQFTTIDLYRDQPPAELVAALYDTVSQLDYIVTSSDRIASAIPRSPWRYPVQMSFLRQLQAGELGFTPVASFQVAPRVGPWVIDDRNADESFINYDHPRVTIYQRTTSLTAEAFAARFAWAVEQPWQPTRYATSPTLRLDGPVGQQPALNDFQWSAGLTSNSLAAAAVWIVMLIALQLIGSRYARALLPRFADSGAGLGIILVLIAVGYVVWLLASLAIAPFHVITVWLVMLLFALISFWLPRWLPAPMSERQRQFGVGALTVFWSVFAFFLMLRVLNPDSWHPIWGGEKPMEFAHLNATMRSAEFPPYDPWFADGYLNYYYYGLYLVAVLIKLTGIPTAIAFNLAQPTFIALLATAGFSVGATIARSMTFSSRGGWLGGAATALLLVAVGNLSAAARLLSNQTQDFSSFIVWVWDGSRAIRAGITEFPFFTALYADLHAHVVALPITVLAIGLCYNVATTGGAVLAGGRDVGDRVDRFRFAALLAVLALTVGSLFPTNAWDLPAYAALATGSMLMAAWSIGGWRRLVMVGGLTFLVLSVAYVLFRPFHEHYVALFSAVDFIRQPTPFAEAATHIGPLATIAVVGLISLLVPWRQFLPWPISQPVLVFGFLAAALLLANLRERVDPEESSSLHTVFLVLVGAVVAQVIWVNTANMMQNARRSRIVSLSAGAGAGLILVGAVIGLAGGQLVLGGYLVLSALAWFGWCRGRTASTRFVALLVLGAAAIGAGVEVIFIADDLAGTTAYRMNTIFKFYNQIWILFSVSGGVLIAAMLQRARLSSRAVIQQQTGPGRTWARGGVVVAGVLLGAALLYPIFALGPRLAQRFQAPPPGLTLNSLAWMQTGTLPWIESNSNGGGELQFADDLAAITWLNANVAGSPVIAEASIGPYRCNGSRFSVATGLPAIIGWERHEQQQRPPAELSPRVQDVRTIYESPDRAVKRAILDRYHVDFVVLGPLERLGIAPGQRGCEGHDRQEGIAALEAMVGTDLEIAFSAGETTIYRVSPEPLVTTP